MAELDFDRFTQDLKKAIENNLYGHDGIEISLCDVEGNPTYQIVIATPDDGFEFVFAPTQQLEDEMKKLAVRVKPKTIRGESSTKENFEQPPEDMTDLQKAIWHTERAIDHGELELHYRQGELRLRQGEIRLMKSQLAELKSEMGETEAGETKTPAEWIV